MYYRYMNYMCNTPKHHIYHTCNTHVAHLLAFFDLMISQYCCPGWGFSSSLQIYELFYKMVCSWNYYDIDKLVWCKIQNLSSILVSTTYCHIDSVTLIFTYFQILWLGERCCYPQENIWGGNPAAVVRTLYCHGELEWLRDIQTDRQTDTETCRDTNWERDWKRDRERARLR